MTKVVGLTMSELTGTVWPRLETAYTDEFGHIALDVYEVAGTLWKISGERFALSTLADAPTGLRLMLKAAAIVTRKQAEPGHLIANLQAYLNQTYRHLVLAELEKENGHRQREREKQIEIESLSVSFVENLEEKILVQQVIKHMDDWMRKVFELSTIGHSYEEIAKILGEDAHRLRAKFSRRLKSLTKKNRPDN